MITTWRRYRSFDRSVRLLLLNQLTINMAFYLLMPYLAAHLSAGLGLATAVVGVILGVRNLSQQGLFVLGGALADRFGFRALIIAGCAVRTVGFALLGFADSVAALIVASAATGLAGALFNPAVRGYLAFAARDRRVEAFALFNVFYSAGILVGPIIGVALTAVTFRLTCAAAAAVFAALTVAQLRSLPPANPAPETISQHGAASGSRALFGNRRFLAFAAAMVGSYVLSFQVYLALPLAVRRAVPGSGSAALATGALFVVSALVTIAAQLRVTDWCRQRWRPGRSITVGVGLMTVAYLPPAVLSDAAAPASIVAALSCAALLAFGSAVAYPFEMDTIVTLSGGHRVATHYGLYHTVAGVGILAGNAVVGDLLGRAGSVTPWLVLAGVGCIATVAIHQLDRVGHLSPAAGPVPPPAAPAAGPLATARSPRRTR